MEQALIAPCGMNCGICLAYLREKNGCPCCRRIIKTKAKSRTNCIIRNCSLLAETDSKFCFDCTKFPCSRLKQLDKRYCTKYKMSMIENLEFIKSKGLENFIQTEKEKWRCGNCGGSICVHRGFCLNCN